MNLLYDVVANLHGSDFLIFYGLVILATYIVCGMIRRFSDRTAAQPEPAIPTQPDPYEIAYLRNGEVEVAQMIVFSLIQRNLLQITPDTQKIEQVATNMPVNILSPIEQYVFNWFFVPHSAKEVFLQSNSLVRRIKPFCEPYRNLLSSDQMFTTSALRKASWFLWLFGATIIIGLGLFKVNIATATGHSNIGFTVIMLIVAPIILLAVCHAPRLSARGKVYLKQLQQAFGSVKENIKNTKSDNTENMYMLAVGLFGISLLAGTQYGYFQEMYQAATASSSSSGGGGGCGGGGCGGGGGGGGGCGGA